MRMFHLGAIAPGKVADILLLRKLESVDIHMVIADGTPVAMDGKLLVKFPERKFDEKAKKTVKLERLTLRDLEVNLPIKNGKVMVNAIDFAEYQGGARKPAEAFLEMVLTKLSKTEVEVRDGELLLGDVALVFVFERHGKNRNRGVGFVRNLIKKGAVASTVAHDSHNLIVVGTNKNDMLKAANLVIDGQGGIAAVKDSNVLAYIQLQVAGLMSEEPLEEVAEKMRRLRQAFREMEVLDHPYMPLVNLLTLSVIPHARITDKGLFDVNSQQFINAFTEA